MMLLVTSVPIHQGQSCGQREQRCQRCAQLHPGASILSQTPIPSCHPLAAVTAPDKELGPIKRPQCHQLLTGVGLLHPPVWDRRVSAGLLGGRGASLDDAQVLVHAGGLAEDRKPNRSARDGIPAGLPPRTQCWIPPKEAKQGHRETHECFLGRNRAGFLRLYTQIIP